MAQVAIKALHREALIGLALGVGLASIWRYGSHFPKRDQIDKFYDELAKEQSNQIAVKRRVTLGVVSQTPVGAKPYSTIFGAKYEKAEEAEGEEEAK
mmetsp:Transcript_3498/g.13832  ORF Transcript_3498/g.13832 Transcript_3498/m.13832 type:complete len:97 (-) Transcript_3498:129-419(-)